MTTKSATTPWANGPLPLIKIPSNELKSTQGAHSYIWCAAEMAHSHNCFIRGLNSIIQQAPRIADATSPKFIETDVRDLLFFAGSWVKTVEWHHHTEETCIFPLISKLAQKPELFEGSKEQHHEFTPGLDRLLAYSQVSQPEAYRWEGEGGMKEIIDSFSDPLMRHLNEEIEVLLSLNTLDSEELTKCWREAENVAKGTGKIGMLYDVFPLVLGNADRTYQGGNDWPPLPWVMPYLINYWFGRSHSGAWRFNSSDFWGNPVQPRFLPIEQTPR